MNRKKIHNAVSPLTVLMAPSSIVNISDTVGLFIFLLLYCSRKVLHR